MATKTAPGDLTVTPHATREDALLITQLLNGPLGILAIDGMAVLQSYDRGPTHERLVEDHPVGSDGYRAVQALLTMSETIATFVKQGLLDKALVYDLFWVRGAWDRCQAIALHERERDGEPLIYANFEALAEGQST
jgi:hypothetical protein